MLMGWCCQGVTPCRTCRDTAPAVSELTLTWQEEDYETPMQPITVMRNALGGEHGGSGGGSFPGAVIWRKQLPGRVDVSADGFTGSGTATRHGSCAGAVASLADTAREEFLPPRNPRLNILCRTSQKVQAQAIPISACFVASGVPLDRAAYDASVEYWKDRAVILWGEQPTGE